MNTDAYLWELNGTVEYQGWRYDEPVKLGTVDEITSGRIRIDCSRADSTRRGPRLNVQSPSEQHLPRALRSAHPRPRTAARRLIPMTSVDAANAGLDWGRPLRLVLAC